MSKKEKDYISVKNLFMVNSLLCSSCKEYQQFAFHQSHDFRGNLSGCPLFSGSLEVLWESIASSLWETSLSILSSAVPVFLFVLFLLWAKDLITVGNGFKLWFHFLQINDFNSLTSTCLSASTTWFSRPLNYAVNESLLFSDKGKISFNLCRLAWRASRKGLGKSFLLWEWQFGGGVCIEVGFPFWELWYLVTFCLEFLILG